jgi:hypothetical protein
MVAAFRDQQWSVFDAHLFACNILRAIQAIREFAGVSTRGAIDMHIERYRRQRAERFACSHEEYRREVYSKRRLSPGGREPSRG